MPQDFELNNIQKEGISSLSVNSGILNSVLGLSQRSSDWEKPIKRGTPKISGNTTKKIPSAMGSPAVWGFFMICPFPCLQGERKDQHTRQLCTQTHTQRLYCYGVNMYVWKFRGSCLPAGTPLSSRAETRQPRRENPPTGLFSSCKEKGNEAYLENIIIRIISQSTSIIFMKVEM